MPQRNSVIHLSSIFLRGIHKSTKIISSPLRKLIARKHWCIANKMKFFWQQFCIFTEFCILIKYRSHSQQMMKRFAADVNFHQGIPFGIPLGNSPGKPLLMDCAMHHPAWQNWFGKWWYAPEITSSPWIKMFCRKMGCKNVWQTS